MEPSEIVCLSVKGNLCRAPGGHHVVLCMLAGQQSCAVDFIESVLA